MDRKLWFITRPERDPKFHRDALIALKEATSGFTVPWRGNREAHLRYEEVLNKRLIKRANISNDGSGGRTWAAMLKTFSYVFEDGDFLGLTKAGHQIVEGIKVRENVSKQILTLQIPNAYSLSSGFRPKYEPGFKIQPARFLIKLLNQPELDKYITKEEITFFVLKARTDRDLQTVANEIKQFRISSPVDKQNMKQEIASLFDHRTRSDNMARNFEEAHGDVSHTFMMLCDYTGLAQYERGVALKRGPDTANVETTLAEFDKRYPFNPRYEISLTRMALSNGLDIDSYKASSFASISPASNKDKSFRKAESMLSAFPNSSAMSKDEIKVILSKEFSEEQSSKYAEDLKGTQLKVLDANFIEDYINVSSHRDFEDKTGEIFKALGFDVEMRPKVNSTTQIEIILKFGSDCIIIDAKNYKVNFDLSASLASHMASEYIPNYDDYEGRRLVGFGYVTSEGFKGTKNLVKISGLAKRVICDRELKGIVLNRKTLLGFLDYCIENNISLDQRVQLFLSAIDNCGFASFDELSAKIGLRQQQ